MNPELRYEPGSPGELDAFAKLQVRMREVYDRVFDDDSIPRTVLVVPSLSLDPEQLARISGVIHYEERMLCLLMLLRMPRTNVIYVTSEPIHPTIIDYYLHLLPGVPGSHARKRLTLLDCDDGSSDPLTKKILERPRLMDRIRAAIPDPTSAHITCFNASDYERSLAVALDIPLYACDPALRDLGNKSQGRRLMVESGVAVPPGYEDLRDMSDVKEALARFRLEHPEFDKAVVKLNDGFSGEGNAVVSLGDTPNRLSEMWLEDVFPMRLEFAGVGETYSAFSEKFSEMGGIVEGFIDSERKESPSVQCRIDPRGTVEVLSSHDQVLGGTHGQVFKGCRFPAADEYRLEIQAATHRVGRRLALEGVIGRFSLDFLSIPAPTGWTHYGLELNIRKGGTTLPNLMLEFLTDGRYDPERGLYVTAGGGSRYYYASDNVEDPAYVGLTPDDLIDISVSNGVHFDATRQAGVVFHLMGALSRYGKLGLVSIAETPKRARERHNETVAVLDAAVAG